MSRDDTSRRSSYARGRHESAFEHDYGHTGTSNGLGRVHDRDYSRDRQFNDEREETYRPSWPEQRGSFGEREYGQADFRGEGGPGYSGDDPMYGRHWYEQGRQHGRADHASWQHPNGFTPRMRAFRESVYGWPHESMGMGTNMPFYGGSQYGSSPYGGAYPQPWGGGVGFGSHLPGQSPYTSHMYGPEYAEPYWQGHGEQHGRSEARFGHMGKGPKGYQRSDDRIHEEICEKLTRDPWIDAREIEVTVKDGEVKISGHVHERRFKHMVEDAVDSVSGVKKIKNELEVEHHHPGFKGEMMGRSNGRDFEEDEMEESREKRGKMGAGR